MHSLSDKLGKIIKSARTEKHLTQKELAKRVSITRHYLMEIENNGQIPSGDLLFHLIRELEIPADTIFYPEYEYDTALLEKLRILLQKADEREVKAVIATLQELIEHK